MVRRQGCTLPPLLSLREAPISLNFMRVKKLALLCSAEFRSDLGSCRKTCDAAHLRRLLNPGALL